MSATTAEATALIKDSYSTAVKGAQDYNTKFIEFAQNNTKAAFDFVQKLSGVKSPSDFIELSTNRSFTQAVRDTDRADQGTCSAGSEGHARDRRASQDGRYQGIRPAHLKLTRSALFRSPGCRPGFLFKSMSAYDPKRTSGSHSASL